MQNALHVILAFSLHQQVRLSESEMVTLSSQIRAN